MNAFLQLVSQPRTSTRYSWCLQPIFGDLAYEADGVARFVFGHLDPLQIGHYYCAVYRTRVSVIAHDSPLPSSAFVVKSHICSCLVKPLTRWRWPAHVAQCTLPVFL